MLQVLSHQVNAQSQVFPVRARSFQANCSTARSLQFKMSRDLQFTHTRNSVFTTRASKRLSTKGKDYLPSRADSQSGRSQNGRTQSGSSQNGRSKGGRSQSRSSPKKAKKTSGVSKSSSSVWSVQLPKIGGKRRLGGGKSEENIRRIEELFDRCERGLVQDKLDKAKRKWVGDAKTRDARGEFGFVPAGSGKQGLPSTYLNRRCAVNSPGV